MTERKHTIPVRDKRRVGKERPDGPAAGEPDADTSEPSAEASPEEQHDYLEDLKRVQAEFENYRKRMVREQTALAERAGARLVERLLPVLDDFQRAIEHGEGGTGVELVYRNLRKTLEDEGLSDIEAEGEAFDPTVHEAVESVDDPEVTEPVVRNVYRTGYRLKDTVLRPAMVVVARPPEADESEEDNGDSADAAEG